MKRAYDAHTEDEKIEANKKYVFVLNKVTELVILLPGPPLDFKMEIIS